jgi:hypothetical protein
MSLFKNNQFLARRVAAAKASTVKNLERTLGRVPLKNQCRMLVNASKLKGVDFSRDALLDGLRKDWTEDKASGKYKTADEALAKPKATPDFDWMLKKLGVNWMLVENIAKDVFNDKT